MSRTSSGRGDRLLEQRHRRGEVALLHERETLVVELGAARRVGRSAGLGPARCSAGAAGSGWSSPAPPCRLLPPWPSAAVAPGAPRDAAVIVARRRPTAIAPGGGRPRADGDAPRASAEAARAAPARAGGGVARGAVAPVRGRGRRLGAPGGSLERARQLARELAGRARALGGVAGHAARAAARPRPAGARASARAGRAAGSVAIACAISSGVRPVAGAPPGERLEADGGQRVDVGRRARARRPRAARAPCRRPCRAPCRCG